MEKHHLILFFRLPVLHTRYHDVYAQLFENLAYSNAWKQTATGYIRNSFLYLLNTCSIIIIIIIIIFKCVKLSYGSGRDVAVNSMMSTVTSAKFGLLAIKASFGCS
jgi:hypothetical protein